MSYVTVDPITEQMTVWEFVNEYAFLSNFYMEAPVFWMGKIWRTSEAAYQAAKFTDPKIRHAIHQALTPNITKRLGKQPGMRSDWEEIKFDVMYEIVRCKFEQNLPLYRLLMGTGNAHLEEGNHWRDNTWGVCPAKSGKGKNWLGIILMRLRDEWTANPLI